MDMRNLIGLAFAASLAMSGVSAAQNDRQWTAGFLGLHLDSFRYDAEDGAAPVAGYVENHNVINIRGIVGLDVQLSDFLLGVEAGSILYSHEEEFKEPAGLTYNIRRGYYTRFRMGMVFDRAMLYGIVGSGSYEGEYNADNRPNEYLLPDGDARERGFGIEFLSEDGSGSFRIEHIIHDFSAPEGVPEYEADSSKLGIGFVSRF